MALRLGLTRAATGHRARALIRRSATGRRPAGTGPAAAASAAGVRARKRYHWPVPLDPPGGVRFESGEQAMATSEAPGEGTILGGVDTPKEIHAAAAMSETRPPSRPAEFPTTPVGYRRLLAWLRSFGSVERVGIEGTGSRRGPGCAVDFSRSKDVEGGRGQPTESP